MTPERWRRIDELFHTAVALDPADQRNWLREECGDDAALRAEVERLIDLDDQAARDGFLTPREVPGTTPDDTTSWPPLGDRADGPVREADSKTRVDAQWAEVDGFTPKAVIALAPGPNPTAETRALVQARLRELPLIYILIFGVMILWRHILLRNPDVTNTMMNALVVAALGGLAYLLSGKRTFSLSRLYAIELVMIGLVATMFTIIQYRVMLASSTDGGPTRAQLVMKNTVIFMSILILTYGIYVPKSWRRAAVVTGVLAVLPFATLLVLHLLHPDAMGWLVSDWQKRGTTSLALFSFDGMLLMVLAVGAAYGAHTIHRLRRQVVEARQLGQYRLMRRIGSGGMGEVYLAEHQLLKRPCAIKLIRPEDVSDSRALERFEREVRITATLSHWNTVEIYDYGRTEDGTYYYVMEYLPGLSLAELVDQHGPLPPERVVYLLRQVCLALREAHAAGLIHRDVKPSNIFAARRGGLDDVAKLLDFGLVLPVSTASASHLSREGQILGTPLFMSPEQAMGARELDERSDIYSLGAVAYYLLTGRPPFVEGGDIGVIVAHARDPVMPPSLFRPGIPDDLERVVMRCLAKSPADRFQDAQDLEGALEDCDCSGSWDQERASVWWSHPSRSETWPSRIA